MADVNTTTTTRVLKMIFTTEGGKNVTMTLKDPSTSRCTATAIGKWMQLVIDDEIVLYNNNKATEIKDSYIYETNTIELE